MALAKRGGTGHLTLSHLVKQQTQADTRRKHRWKRRLKTRAATIKKQLQTENRLHKAMQEIHTTSDHYRYSYLLWILLQMFSLFDYETGLQAINDKTAYSSWLSTNRKSNNRIHQTCIPPV